MYLSNGILHSKIAESLSKNYRHFFYEHSDFALKKAKAEIIQIKFWRLQISATSLFRTFAESMNKENIVTLKITPSKIYKKNPDQPLCRLCGKESGRFSNISSKPGKSKCLQHQIFLNTGINILETDNLLDIISRNCKRFIESAVTFRNESFKTQHTLSTLCSIKRVISLMEQEYSTNAQNDCIKPTQKSLKFMEHSRLDISNHRDNTIVIDIRPFTPINMDSTVSFLNEKFVSVQHFQTKFDYSQSRTG